jgi:signal transduction histidine kinase
MQIPDISPDLQEVLQHIVNDVVERLGCMGAMVTTLEQGSLLVLRAYELRQSLEDVQASSLFSVLGDIGHGTIFKQNDPAHQENLAIRAVWGNGRSHKSLTSDSLHDLFLPYVSRGDADRLQQMAGVRQVIAIPFQLYGEVVGSLMAATAERFSDKDIGFLDAFGRQAATAIQSQRRLDMMQTLERIILHLQARMTNETEVLQVIVDAVVEDLGYAGAMVATLENGDALPVRAFAIDDEFGLVGQYEEMVGISLLGEQAAVYLKDARYQENLSVRAITGLNGRPQNYLISKHLHDLLRPHVSREIADQIQQVLGLKRVVAVPFFQGDRVLGNLFVTSRKPRFSAWELSILTALGQQAAVGIHNARLFRETVEQRQIAQTFGRMAFSTIASAHSLRNYVGNINGYVQLLQMLPEIAPDRQQIILRDLPAVSSQLNKVIDILNNLNEPWLAREDEPVDAHDCLARALLEIYPRTTIMRDQAEVTTETNVTLYLDLAESLPPVETVKDMLSEAFRIIIKNADEAMANTGRPANLWISSRQKVDGGIEISIRDNGSGIPSKDLPHIFELGWSTKKGNSGMGIGLFWTKDYIDGLGGRIIVSSVEGEGTAFQIMLPAAGTRP